MGFDIVAWYESKTGTAALVAINGLADPHVTVSGTNITAPLINGQPPQVMFAMVGQTNITDTMAAAQLSAPSLRGRTLLDIPVLQIPYDTRIAAAGSSTGTYVPATASTTYNINENPPISWFINSPVVLTPGENMQMNTASSGTTATCLETAVVGLGDGNYVNPFPGAVETIRATYTATATAHAWSNTGALTMTQTLRAGRYAIIGMKAFTTGANACCQAARLVLPETPHRPGCIGVTNISHKGDPLFRQGNLGVWGQFTHTSIPTVDILSNVADTSGTIFFDVVKIG